MKGKIKKSPKNFPQVTLYLVATAGLYLFFLSCSQPVEPPLPPGVIEYTYQRVAEYPHLQDAFTQGLVFYDGFLYEGTGLYGHSSLRRVALETGEILQIQAMGNQYFGEGITILNRKIIQLTWQSRIGFIYDLYSFTLLDTFSYQTQGWGITHDNRNLIMSDGSSTLRFLDTLTYQVTGQIEVTSEGNPINQLNELEYINGKIYANIWRTDKIAIITPETGAVAGWIYLDQLLDPQFCSEPIDVLNGIAYDSENDRLFVTGKLWCKLFEIKLVRR